MGQASNSQEYACRLEQDLSNEAKLVVMQGKALVIQQPGIAHSQQSRLTDLTPSHTGK